jgi:indolepyruvate decarboxylase
MHPKMQLGDFLVAYLARAGVEHIFGLPGDLALGLFHRFGQARNLKIITLSHEPAVGFAADGYARSTRRLGVVCITYGAGGHNILNPIAGAYAEQVPLLVVSGGPGSAEASVSAIHHQVKDIEAQCRIFSEVTCAAKIIERPELAAEEIHEIVRTIFSQSRPGYLEIHRDLVDLEISVPKHIRDWNGRFPPLQSDARKLKEAINETVGRIKAAKHPILIGGVELHRVGAEREFLALAEKLQAPVVTTVLAKGVFPMDHPLHMGIHVGPLSAPEISKRVKGADLVLAMGTQLTDLNLAATKPQVVRDCSVWATSRRVNISFHSYTDVMLKDFVEGLVAQKLPKRREKIHYYDNLKRNLKRPKDKLSINNMLVEINDFLEDHHGYDVFAESGDSLFGGLELRPRQGGMYYAQGYYASMGFAVPAALGTQIGTGRRPLVLVGDGGFQMTGMEVSHAPRLGLSPVLVVVNNAGWGIFRPVTANQELLDLPPWPYAELAESWGGVGIRVQSPDQLHGALRAADQVHGFVIIECIVPKTDSSPVSRRYIQRSASKGRKPGKK